MRFSTERSGKHSYLLYQFTQTDRIETMSFGQLSNNSIPGLVPSAFTQKDGAKIVRYDTTSLITLEDYLKVPVRKAEFLQILSGILAAVSSAQDYMIDPQTMLFDKMYTYLEPETLAVSLVCLPVQNRDWIPMDLQAYLWRLVARTSKDKSESREYVVDLMEKLGSEESLTVSDMVHILREFTGEPQEPEIPEEEPDQDLDDEFMSSLVEKEPAIPEEPEEEPEEVLEAVPEELPEEKTWVPEVTQEILLPEQDTIVADDQDLTLPVADFPENRTVIDEKNLSEYLNVGKDIPAATDDDDNDNGGQQKAQYYGNETVLEVHEEQVPVTAPAIPCLVREKGNDVIRITGKIFQIGSDYDYCDFQVKGNRTVSSIHAQIIKHGNEYYIKDMSSRFKTYLDERPIPSMEEIKLRHGTKIRMGTERFVFTLY